MKTINYTGSSKLISRIVNLLNRKTPLPLDGDGDPDWGTNGQVLSTDGTGNTAWVNAGGGGDSVSWTQDVTTGTKIASIDINGNSTDVYAPSAGSGGHTIENTSGTDLPQEDNLQFVGVYTRDDSGNDRTEVNIVREMTKAQMTALSSAEAEGFIYTTDEDDIYEAIDAEDVKYGGSDVKTKLDALTTEVSGKVSKSGDTMTGALSVTSPSTATPLSLKGSSANTTYLSLLNSSGTELGKIGANGGHPIWQYSGINTNIATWGDLFMNRATPFFLTGNSKSNIKFTFTGLSASGSIHLFIFALTCSGEILAACSASGFSSLKRTLLTDGDDYHLGTMYAPNNGYTFTVNVGTWSSVWGIFIHTDYPNAAMTMEWITL